MSITFKPLSDNVLVDYGDSNEEEKTKGGIIMTTNKDLNKVLLLQQDLVEKLKQVKDHL